MLNIVNGLIVLLLSINVAFASTSTSTSKTLTDWQTTLPELLNSSPTKLVGKATFSVFIWDIYKSKLSTTSGRFPDKAGSLVYQINYLKNIDSEDLIEKTVEQWQHLEFKPERYQGYVSQLKSMWPDIKEGDQLAFVTKSGKSAFYYNNQLIGSIDNPDFATIFLAIWFSENTTQPALRDKLLGIAS